jgi:hypothetical protein
MSDTTYPYPGLAGTPLPTETYVVPSTPTPPPSVVSLPTDQPWFLVNNESRQCGYGVGSRQLITIDPTGRSIQLDHRITAWAERPGAPPLLATCSADGVAAIVDPVDWIRHPVALRPGSSIDSLVVSPDQQRAIIRTICWAETPCAQQTGQSPETYMLDLHTWAIQPAYNIPQTYAVGGPYQYVTTVDLLEWSSDGLYYSTTGSKAGPTTLDLIDPDDPLAGSRVLLQNASYHIDSSRGRVVSMDIRSKQPGLTLLDLRQDTTETIEQGTWIGTPALSPDGSTLVYLRFNQNLSQIASSDVDIVLFDLEQHTKTVIARGLGTPAQMWYDGIGGALFWSQDSQRIITITSSSGGTYSAFLLARDGTLFNKVSVATSRVFGITNDDQLVMGDRALTWVPLRPGDAPYAPTINLDPGMVEAAYLAPSGTPPPQAAPEGSPAVSDPRPASVLASISDLGSVPNDTELLADPPLLKHVLYQTRGTLYSQALDGGAQVALGGAASDPATLIFVAADEQTAVIQQRGGVYRVALADGTRERLTPALAEGDALRAHDVQVSPDGSRLVYAMAGTVPKIFRPQFSPDGRWTNALYSVPIIGGDAVRITPPLEAEQAILQFKITADSQRVVYALSGPTPNWYIAPQPGDPLLNVIAFYSTPLSEGTSTLLLDSLSTSKETMLDRWFLVGADEHLVYQNSSPRTVWSVALNSGARAHFDFTDSNADYINFFWPGPDGISMIYQTPNGSIFRLPLAGGEVQRLTSDIGEGMIISAQLGPDRTQVVFVTSDGLYQVPSAGGSPAQILAWPDPNRSMLLNQLSTDSRYVVYTTGDPITHMPTILGVPLAGGPSVVLFSGQSHIPPIFYTFSGEYVIGAVRGTLYAAPLAGGPQIQLSRDPSRVNSPPVISADGRVIYLARPTSPTAENVARLMIATLVASQP